MRQITLLTDFGWKDYYVGLIKGRLLSTGFPMQMHDLSHEIEPFNLTQAAWLFKNCYEAFPQGTLHLLSVYGHYDKDRCYLAIEHNGQFFVGPDNGLFSLIFERIPSKIYKIQSNWAPSSLEEQWVFSHALVHLQKHGHWEGIGPATHSYRERLTLRPALSKDQIRGSIAHIDQYGNAITNISRQNFEQVGQGRNFRLHYRRFDPITELHADYTGVLPGEMLCLFNASEMLELSVYLGQASTLYNLNIDDAILVSFD